MVTKDQLDKEERVKKGVEEILTFRGYKITDTNTDEEYIDFFAEKTDEDGEETNLIVRYPRKASIGVKTIRELDKFRKEQEIQDAIIIAEGALTHYAKRECLEKGVEIISGTNPLFNIFDHMMVPLHIKLEEDEVEEVLKRYQIQKHQLPKILDSDPAIKAIQAQPGDIIKIIRNPDMGEAGVYYRYVIRSTSRLRLITKAKQPSFDEEEEPGFDEDEIEEEI